MLTLPIQIGKKYVRRDGVVVVAKNPHYSLSSDVFFVGTGENTGDTLEHVFSTGLVYQGRLCDLDLIADAEEKPAGHPHAALMMLYAQDWAETDTPWLRWQAASELGFWCTLDRHPHWHIEFQYRRKPRTIKIGDCEIQAGERVAPALGSPYWVPVVLYSDEFSEELEWNNDEGEIYFLKRGFVHLTPEAAQAHAKALIALTAIK